jgi:hypothetical protein
MAPEDRSVPYAATDARASVETRGIRGSPTGERRRLGSITRAGSRHAPRLLSRRAWNYRCTGRSSRKARRPTGRSAAGGDRDLLDGAAPTGAPLGVDAAAWQTTHEVVFARDVGDRVVFMDWGVIVEEAPARQVIESPKEEDQAVPRLGAGVPRSCRGRSARRPGRGARCGPRRFLCWRWSRRRALRKNVPVYGVRRRAPARARPCSPGSATPESGRSGKPRPTSSPVRTPCTTGATTR